MSKKENNFKIPSYSECEEAGDFIKEFLYANKDTPHEEFGRIVAEEQGRKRWNGEPDPFGAKPVSSWRDGKIDYNPTLIAVAKVIGVKGEDKKRFFKLFGKPALADGKHIERVKEAVDVLWKEFEAAETFGRTLEISMKIARVSVTDIAEGVMELRKNTEKMNPRAVRLWRDGDSIPRGLVVAEAVVKIFESRLQEFKKEDKKLYEKAMKEIPEKLIEKYNEAYKERNLGKSRFIKGLPGIRADIVDDVNLSR